MKTDVEIAGEATPRPIVDVTRDLGFSEEDLHPYGRDVAKVDLDVLDRPRALKGEPRLVLVSAITPTEDTATASVEKLEFSHEAKHLLQILTAIEMKQMVAGKPVNATSVPVIPEQPCMLGRGQSVADTPDDHEAFLGNRRSMGERCRGREQPSAVLDREIERCESHPNRETRRLPFQHQVEWAHDRHVGNRELKAIFDAGEKCCGPASEADAGDTDLRDTSFIREPVDEGA